MTAQTARSELQLNLPDFHLKPNQGLALNLVKRDLTTNTVLGGISLVVAGEKELDPGRYATSDHQQI